MKCHMIVNSLGAPASWVRKTAAALYGLFRENEVCLDEGRLVYLCSSEDERNIQEELPPFCDVVRLALDVPSAAAAAAALARDIEQDGLYLLGNDDLSRELAARLAAAFGGSAVPDADALTFEDGGPVCRRPVYSGHMEGIFRLVRAPYFVCMAAGAKTAAYPPVGEQRVSVRRAAADAGYMELTARPRTSAGMEDAAFLIAAGNGVRDEADLKQLRELAERMGGRLAVSRALSLRPFAAEENMIGISGSVAAPDTCLVVGASGASAFYSGLERCGFIAAINTDENAPILSKCDCAAVEDYGPVLRALCEILERKRGDG